MTQQVSQLLSLKPVCYMLSVLIISLSPPFVRKASLDWSSKLPSHNPMTPNHLLTFATWSPSHVVDFLMPNFSYRSLYKPQPACNNYRLVWYCHETIISKNSLLMTCSKLWLFFTPSLMINNIGWKCHKVMITKDDTHLTTCEYAQSSNL